MNARPIAEFLTRFGKEPVPIFQETEPEGILITELDNPDEQVDCVELARSEGIAEGLASFEVVLKDRLEEQRLLFEEQLAAEKSIWRSEEAAFISDQIKVALEVLEAAIADSIERILRPFVMKAIIDKTVIELCELVRALLCDRELCFIEIRSPEKMMDELRRRLAMYQAIKFVESDSLEVLVFTNQAIVETQFALWFDRISLLSE